MGDGGSPAIDRGFQFGTQNNNQELFCQFNGPTEPWPTNAFTVGLASAIPVGQWTHVACTYDNSELRLYRDGTLAGSGFVGPKTIANSASNLRISLDDNSNVPFDGIIDEAKVYNVALPAAAFLKAATCNHWKDPVSGDWTDGTKWTAGVPPGASDLACITATGAPYTVTLNANSTVAGFTLDSPDASFFASSRTFTVNGPSIINDGDVTWRNSSWTGTGEVTNSSTNTMIFQGSSSINGPFTQNGTIIVQGSSVGSNATLTVADGMTNNGTTILDSIDAVRQANLTVSSGILNNLPAGTITANLAARPRNTGWRVFGGMMGPVQ